MALHPAVFVVGCLGVRTAITWLAKTAGPDKLKTMGRIALIPAVGFMVIYVGKLRRTGAEVAGEAIWWDRLRPLHALLWGGFAALALRGHRGAWKLLALDTLIGAGAWANK